MADLFENISKEALVAGITPRTKQSMEWFSQKMKDMAGINRETLFRTYESKKRNRLIINRDIIGTMHMFRYKPQGREKLKYYDIYPLVIIVGESPEGFKGLNLHYLPIDLRAKFLDLLYKELNNDEFDESTRFTAFWNRLNRGFKKRYLKPCIKSYLTSHIIGRISEVESKDWEIAAFLPFQRFIKQPQQQVWRDSYRQVRNK